METLMERGIANGLEGIRKLSGDELRELNLTVAGSVHYKCPRKGLWIIRLWYRPWLRI